MSRKQTELPGVEAPSVPEIDEAADAYVDVRDKRMKLTEKEIAARTALTTALLANKNSLLAEVDGTLVYRYDDQIVRYQPGKPKVSVRTEADDDAASDAD